VRRTSAPAQDDRPVVGETAAGPRKPGRPRDPSAGKAILDATLLELADHGFAGFTIDQVAARAGVSKATIYRRWPGKEDLAFAAAASAAKAWDTVPDTGSVREDLIQLFDRAFERKDNAADAVMAGLIAEAIVNDKVRALLEDYSRQRRAVSRTLVDRALDRGELPADCDADLLLELVAGPLLYRSMITGGSLERPYVTTLVDAALRAVGAT